MALLLVLTVLFLIGSSLGLDRPEIWPSLDLSRCPPGEVTRGRIVFGETPDGMAVYLPFYVVKGVSHGPVLWLGACQHGDERQGIENLRIAALVATDPKELRGTLICTPINNPLAFRRNHHDAIEDGKEMTFCLPGDPNGTITERLGHILYTQFAKQCDAAIDFHSVGRVEYGVIYKTEDPELNKRTAALAQAYGIPFWKADKNTVWAVNHIVGATTMLGKPCLTTEPAWPLHDKPLESPAVMGVRNVMKHLGMIDGTPEPQKHNLLPGGYYRTVTPRANAVGMMNIEVGVGDYVKSNQVVAVIHDVWGRRLSEVRTSEAGWIRQVTGNRVSNIGRYTVWVLVPLDWEKFID